MTETEWLCNLKPGDEVFITLRYGRHYDSALVSRITDSQIVISFANLLSGYKYDRKFRKRDGAEIGLIDRNYLRMPTPERREEREIALLQDRVNRLRGKLSTPNDRQTLEAMVAALTPFVKDTIK